MLRALRFLLRKEFLQIGRDRVILRMLIVMPMIQLVILANAATFEVKRARLFVVDHDRTPASRGVVNALTASGRFRLEAASASMAHADEALLSRDVDAIVASYTFVEEEARAAALMLIGDPALGGLWVAAACRGILQGSRRQCAAPRSRTPPRDRARALPAPRFK